MKRLLPLILLSLMMLAPTACSRDDVENVYSNYRAYFRYDKVITAHPLYVALTGTGEYCSIFAQGTEQGTTLYFQGVYEQAKDLLTAPDYYQSVIWIGGLIVGRSNVPDMTDGTLPLLCFDRVCPNCYKDDNISKPLTLQEFGQASCSRCKRTYDLNNLGIIASGEKGIKLIRYHITYNGSNTVVVSNR
ncbi:MAG: hypothetical protein IJ244_02150 [Bacteroidaceae bacterium]|nr:hypothetical protein [Bacteroidaceae bacterium]